ncbi:glutaredoxin family protein [Paraglaciecola aquimarina]|uniref:Glutaredoxin family protein n=1 Tax=Paraglaciecola aquimarina TaxID=1235557 RepID=A0ABU3SYV8_9ALTE|nr:glutaredoxin family protein [Paraglaciecola aquimarina]MDU0355188.1 glutaredoxin family protein [Paraglaciecola aquimarina]
MEIILYSGQDCCLCDQAEALLNEVDPKANIKVKKIDVKSSTELYHLYGARIPVLFNPSSQQELPWPFDSSTLREFIL